MRTGIMTALPRQVAATKGASGSGPVRPGTLFNLSELGTRSRTRGFTTEPGHDLFAGGSTVEHGAASTVLAATVLARQPGLGLGIGARREVCLPAPGHPDFGSARPVFVEARHDARQALEEIES